MRELTSRVATGAVAISFVSGLLFVGKYYEMDWVVALLLVSGTYFCGLEYLRLMRKNDIQLEKYSFISLSLLVELSFVFFNGKYSPLFLWGTIALLVLIYLPYELSIKKALGSVFGIFYIPYFLHFFYLLYVRGGKTGLLYCLLVLIMVWCYDIGAYVVGTLWGKHSLAPKLSPNKTWEGVGGGIVFTLIGANTSPIWIPWLTSLPHIFAISIIIGLTAQLGDLFESKLKRSAKVKDSGTFFPGHGGVLDRLDGLLFAIPVFYFYFHYVLGYV